MFSERVSVHLTGRCSCRANAAASTCSQYAPVFAPKPPPTAGAITCTWSGSISSAAARPSRTPNGAWVGTFTSSLPSACGSTRMPFDSIGTAATRWLTKRPLTTTSASSRICGSWPKSNSIAMFEPCSGNSSVASRLERRLRIDDHRQRVVVDDHHLRGIDGLRARLRDDSDDDVADEAHDPVGERGSREHRREHDEALNGGERECLGELGALGRVDRECVVCGNREHARHRRGIAGVDPRDRARAPWSNARRRRVRTLREPCRRSSAPGRAGSAGPRRAAPGCRGSNRLLGSPLPSCADAIQAVYRSARSPRTARSSSTMSWRISATGRTSSIRPATCPPKANAASRSPSK